MESPQSTQIITSSLMSTEEPLLEHIEIKTHAQLMSQLKMIHTFSIDFSIDVDSPPTTTIIAQPATAHGLASAIIQAYSRHQHLSLSPDDIWLTIAQGVSRHINYNAERFRHYFVEHEGKEDIIIDVRDILMTPGHDTPITGDWPKAITRLVNETDNRIKKVDLKKIVECDFSTSDFTSIITSRIILLDAMKEYFTYHMLIMGCGIPKLTLKGTLNDWLNLQQKVANLRSLGLDLDFWLDRLEPVIAQFVATYKGEVNEDFWSVIKSQKPYGSGMMTPCWDGWICAFFPYDKKGKKLNLNQIVPDQIPDGLLHVPFIISSPFQTRNCQMSAGFLGARQEIIDNEIVVSPVIGWYVSDA
ncbi:8847_t:CDS:1 [Ambispora gerdemannii]|uniref:8847_t:CDS:1 n=1 Tax=Ambispora gerdemannii TaxID=144530 RepID=A0A9N9H2F6_9GLOM|nr:8847_t:CDS:1 [Ambispora gerdemannii]